MQNGQDSKALWPMAAPMMAWSPQIWMAMMFGQGETATSKSGATTAANPVIAAEQALQSVATGGSGLVKASAQTGAELLALASRRTQAIVALTGEITKCRAPQEAMSLQMQFWQAAVQQHTEAAHRIAALWTGVLPMLANVAPGGTAASTARDRITFPDTRETMATGSTQQPTWPQGDRRSAA